MGDFELLSLVIASLSPLYVGVILCSRAGWQVVAHSLYESRLASRRRWHSVRFFECAAPGRMPGRVRLSLVSMHILVLVILYDIDIFMFFIETALVEQ